MRRFITPPLLLSMVLALFACLMEQYMVSMLTFKPAVFIGLELDYSSSMGSPIEHRQKN